MKGNGKMIFSMAKEKKCGPTGLSMKENMCKGKNTALESIVGMMAQCIKESGTKTK